MPGVIGFKGFLFLFLFAIGETRTLSLRIFSEIIAIFVNHDSADSELIQQQTKKLHRLVIDSILPQYVCFFNFTKLGMLVEMCITDKIREAKLQ